MTDDEILSKIGLSDDDATELCQTIAGLRPELAYALNHGTSDMQEAAAALGPDCSVADLQRFLTARKGDQPSIALIGFTPQGDDD